MGTQSSVNIMLPSDISELFRSEGLHPRRMTLQPWATHRETRQHGKGVFLKSVPRCTWARRCTLIPVAFVLNSTPSVDIRLCLRCWRSILDNSSLIMAVKVTFISDTRELHSAPSN